MGADINLIMIRIKQHQHDRLHIQGVEQSWMTRYGHMPHKGSLQIKPIVCQHSKQADLNNTMHGDQAGEQEGMTHLLVSH